MRCVLRPVARAAWHLTFRSRRTAAPPLNSSVSRQCRSHDFRGAFVATWSRSHAPASEPLRPASSQPFRARLAGTFLSLRRTSPPVPGSTHPLRSRHGLRRFVQHRALPWWHRRLTRRSSGRRTAAAYLCVRRHGVSTSRTGLVPSKSGGGPLTAQLERKTPWDS